MGRHSAGDDEDEVGDDVVWVPVPASQITGEIPRIQLTGEIPAVQVTGEIAKITQPLAAPPLPESTAVLPDVEQWTDGTDEVSTPPDAGGASGSAAVLTVVVDPHISATHADLNLIRAVPGLRAGIFASVVVPFLLYTVAMVLMHRMDVYLIWLWIPTVLAGVLVGHFLDRAHARAHIGES
ncbi:MAG TPA: hypothetical protein VGL26_03405 [Jatrophihabitans sp.]